MNDDQNQNNIQDDTEEIAEHDVFVDEEIDNDNTDLIKKLREKLKVAVEEKQKYLDSWQRDKAEFVNARKRDEEDKKNILKYSEERIVSELIPILDSFDMAMGNKEAWEKADQNWRVGVEYIYSQLLNTLTNHGLVKINPKGELFDPKYHEAVASVSTGRKDENHVVMEVVSYGYSLNGKNIRPAQVKVGEFEI